MPKFARPSAKNPASVEDFLSDFECRLEADNYPSSRYSLALAAVCDVAEAKWVKSNIVATGLGWAEAKDAFIRHFVDDDILTL